MSTEDIIEARGARAESLIGILQDVQAASGHVSEADADMVAEALGISPTRVYGVLTFYAQFRLRPPGEHSIRVCLGTACHVMGGERILEHLKGRLGVDLGGTTADGRFTLERVACVGCCGMAPVVLVDDTPHGNCTVLDCEELLEGAGGAGDAGDAGREKTGGGGGDAGNAGGD